MATPLMWRLPLNARNRCKSPCKILEIIFVAISNFFFVWTSDWLTGWLARLVGSARVPISCVFHYIFFRVQKQMRWIDSMLLMKHDTSTGINDAIKLTRCSISLPSKLWYMLCTRDARSIDDEYDMHTPVRHLPPHRQILLLGPPASQPASYSAS